MTNDVEMKFAMFLLQEELKKLPADKQDLVRHCRLDILDAMDKYDSEIAAAALSLTFMEKASEGS